MKNLKNVAKMFLIMFFISSCQNETIQNQNDNQQTAFDKLKTEYASEIYNDNESSRICWSCISFIRVESDLVDADHGCYTVNVRVYLSNTDGDEYLVANQNVQVGECRNGERNANTECEGRLPNGDYVIDNGTVGDKECLYDLLIEKPEIYDLYLISVDKTINGN